MNIIIPIGGIGKRFSDKGYKMPKPLIKANGKQIIFHLIDSLNIKNSDKLYIPYRLEFDEFNFQETLLNRYPDYEFIFCPIEKNTKGASETVLFSLKEMADYDLNKNVIVIDSDSFFDEDILLKVRNKNKNCIFYVEDKNLNPIYSYIKIEENKVISIEEKVKISNNACVGAYSFESGKLLLDIINKVITTEKNKQKGEYYISGLYKEILKKGIDIYSLKLNGFNCLGTPSQLKSFSSKANNISEKLRICFDLDNTLVTYPKTKGDYSTVEPIEKNIKKLNYYKSLGHHIIIHTARRMKTHNGNVGSILADIGKVTIETLEKFNISYDELYFGKPYANFYIDDLAINSFDNIDKEIGLYDIHPEPREHNEIIFLEKEVVKKSKNLQGEIFFYKNLNNKIKHLFPELLKTNDIDELIISKIKGLTFSYLYTDKLLTENDLLILLENLNNIHFSEKIKKTKVNIYQNYYSKMEKRESEIFDNISIEDQIFYNKIKNDLKKYENQELGKIGIIHGDPVFTNVLKNQKDKITFIDMRGRLGDENSIYGDIFYDYAKVYQSIIGYEFILLNKKTDISYQKKIIDFYEEYIINKFGKKRLEYIKLITSSLLLSLIPLHGFKNHKEYIQLSKNIYNY